MRSISPRSPRAALGALLAALLLAALAPGALAAPPSPKPKDPAIKPGKVLGGVKIGQPLADAQAAWGGEGDCDVDPVNETTSCTYGSVKNGIASITAFDGDVIGVSLAAPVKGAKFVFTGPLMKFGTKKGDLGLGDQLTDIADRYPDGDLKGQELVFASSSSRMEFFTGDGTRGKVSQIIFEAR